MTSNHETQACTEARPSKVLGFFKIGNAILRCASSTINNPIGEIESYLNKRPDVASLAGIPDPDMGSLDLGVAAHQDLRFIPKRWMIGQTNRAERFPAGVSLIDIVPPRQHTSDTTSHAIRANTHAQLKLF